MNTWPGVSRLLSIAGLGSLYIQWVWLVGTLEGGGGQQLPFYVFHHTLLLVDSLGILAKWRLTS